jgi:hypothetical protein
MHRLRTAAQLIIPSAVDPPVNRTAVTDVSRLAVLAYWHG